MNNDRIVWINIHIPKCGGSTFVEILRRNFGRGFRDGRSLLDTYQFTADQVEQLLRFHPEITCYSDHKLTTDLPWDRPGLNLRVIAFVRNPVDRFLSHYFYHRNHSKIVPETHGLTLDDYIEWALEQNHQQIYRTGQRSLLFRHHKEKKYEHFEALIDSGQFFPFTLERFDEACIGLERMFPETFRDCSYTMRNVSRRDQQVSEEQRQRIAQYAELDMELHRFIDRRMEQWMAGLFPDPAERTECLARFHQRCRRRQALENSPPWRLGNWMKHRIREWAG